MNRLLPCSRWVSLAAALLFPFHAQAETSALWGSHGERWNPRSRLPDFSYAGYHCGETSLPRAQVTADVRSFGAKGDGETNDTEAFLAAIAAVKKGVLFIPPGRYRITKILQIDRPGVVLRGAGTEKTTLYFPTPLNEIKPDWGETTSGKRTSNYSWSGGFVWFKGHLGLKQLADITAPASRGETSLTVSSANRLRSGQRVVICETDNPDNSLAAELYSGDPGDTGKLKGRTKVSFVVTILQIEGQRIMFDRPLRCDIQLRWKPCVRSYEPTVVESGVEDLAFEFPSTPYKGHFTELGYNAVAFDKVADCWARNIRVLNADSGIFVNGCFCTIQRLVVQSQRQTDKQKSTGHHGFSIGGQDNLLTDFDFQTQFIHDLTVDGGAAGNVFACGKAADLSLDHHKCACYENLFTDIDAGTGTHLWRHGGGDALGKPCAARGTFWNIRAARSQPDPPADFGPSSMNLVAVQSDGVSVTNEQGRWREVISPSKIVPSDIYAAQLAQRIKAR